MSDKNLKPYIWNHEAQEYQPLIAGTCKTCKHWAGNDGSANLYNDGDTIRHCYHPKVKEDKTMDGDECLIDGIYATCDESRGCLYVGRDFGCIHHTPKE